LLHQQYLIFVVSEHTFSAKDSRCPCDRLE